ncbi:MAG: hypothetical protein KDA61_04435 [Planctomycetales bacterium]|nr:hypothetical protein [Planctomycetales bacterium]
MIRMLAIQPDDRPSIAGRLVLELEEVLSDRRIMTTHPKAAEDHAMVAVSTPTEQNLTQRPCNGVALPSREFDSQALIPVAATIAALVTATL